MLLVLFIIICIIGVICGCKDEYGTVGLIGTVTALLMVICILVSAFILIDSYANTEAFIAGNNQRYESLIYQMENNLYDNDNDLGKK